MNQPKPIQIRLPFSVPRPNKSEASTSRICGMCRKETSKYTCPRCNIAYCSLACFRDEKHAQCSEPFYRNTIISEIGNDDKATLEEKKAMLEMLKRFEEGAEGVSGFEEDEEDEDELSSALEGVDLESVDSNELFKLLPPEHREKFLAALRNPESEETKALLDQAVAEESGTATSDPNLPSELPWFEEPIPNDSSLPYASPPNLISEEYILGIKPPDGAGSKLAYNAIGIALAYLHTLLSFRLPSTSPSNLEAGQVSADELQEEIGALAPFLVEARSTIRHETLRSAWSSVWDTIGAHARKNDEPTPPLDALLRLLQSAAGLLHPTPDELWPSRITLLLSDLHSLWSKPKINGPITKKLAFYIVALNQLRMADWSRLEMEVAREINKLRDENGLPDPDEHRERSNFLA